jgi:predicted DNA-binding protein (MmcQ/YjbR family)
MGKITLEALESALRDQALAYPDTEEAFPWGERAMKVNGKAFLFMRREEKELSFSVKLPRTSVQALVFPFASPTGYGLGRHGWITIRLDWVPDDLGPQCREWLDESYRAVASKRAIAKLDAGAPSATPRAAKAPVRKTKTSASGKKKAATKGRA